MRPLLILLLCLAPAAAGAKSGPASWYERVGPIMTGEEKRAYRSLIAESERAAFEASFWLTRQITQEEYFRRAQFADDTFGSGRAGSGANTDQGRVYLSLGSPHRKTRLPSSRTFFPIEIWYYSEAPGIGVQYELQLLFFQSKGIGDYKLYSPTLNTIRNLMNPQPATRGLFAVNSIVTEGDIRTRLTLSPAEDEVVTAAIGVARGVTGMGNDEILALVASPRAALSREARTRVRSRFVFTKPELVTFQTTSPEGTPQVDLMLRTKLKNGVKVEVLSDGAAIFRGETSVPFPADRDVAYQQRLDLLPGVYTLVFTVDERAYPYPLNVAEPAKLSEILIATSAPADGGHTPFAFDGLRVDPDERGSLALVECSAPKMLTWRLRQGIHTRWTKHTTGKGIVTQNLAEANLPLGEYELELTAGSESRTTKVRLGEYSDGNRSEMPAAVISQNATLRPSERLRLLARQYLKRSDIARARTLLEKADRLEPSDSVKIDLSRVEALTGKYDEARLALKEVLARNPENVEALTALAYVEVQLQDYAVAAVLYRRVLAIQRSPVVERALASLPKQ